MIIKRILKDWGLEVLILSFFIVVIIPFGAGITFDSVSFFQAGENFWSSGKYIHYGPTELEFAAHRFPLYPIIVGLFRSFDPNLLALQIILFTALIAVFRRFLNEQKSPKYFLLALATFPFVFNHFNIWTESLYAVLFVWILLELYQEEKYQRGIWIAVIVVLLCLTRMVGVVVAGSLLVAYLIDKRPLRGVLYCIVGLAIIVSWTLLGKFYLGETARELAYHPVSAQDLWYLIVEFGKWITPVDIAWIPFVVSICLMLLPVVLALRAWKNRHEVGVLFWFLIIHFYAYISFIVLSKMFIDASIPFGVRQLYPLIINYLGILIMMQNSMVLNEKIKAKIRFVFPKLLILIVGMNVSSIWFLHDNGVGYNSKEWQDYEFPEEIGKLSTSLVYTNDTAPIYLFGNDFDQVVSLPQKKDLYSQQLKPEYQASLDVSLFILEQSLDGKIIWVRNGITADIYPSYEELRDHPRLDVLYDDYFCLILEPNMYYDEIMEKVEENRQE